MLRNTMFSQPLKPDRFCVREYKNAQSVTQVTVIHFLNIFPMINGVSHAEVTHISCSRADDDLYICYTQQAGRLDFLLVSQPIGRQKLGMVTSTPLTNATERPWFELRPYPARTITGCLLKTFMV